MANPNTIPAPVPFHFGDIDLSEVVLINNVPYMTRRAIGEFLEYADPQKAIDNILSRNQHIFEFQYPSLVRGTDGKNYDTFLYNPVGFMLICMQSDQPKAIQMKLAIAQFVHHFCFELAEAEPLTVREKIAVSRHIADLTRQLEEASSLLRKETLFGELRGACALVGKAVPDIKKLALKADQADVFEGGAS